MQAAYKGRLAEVEWPIEQVQWIRDENGDSRFDKAFSRAMCRRHLDVAAYLHKLGGVPQRGYEVALDGAADSENAAIVECIRGLQQAQQQRVGSRPQRTTDASDEGTQRRMTTWVQTTSLTTTPM